MGWKEDLAASSERAAVVRYLRRAIVATRHRAANLRADTSQNEPDARQQDAIAVAIDELAKAIENGRHWR